jgi:hypothetical protein
MNTVRITLVSDGPTDEVLLRHLRWLLEQHLDPAIAIQSEWADLRSTREKPKGLSERIRLAVDLYPCDILFVHRDAEKEKQPRRFDEIRQAVQPLRINFAETIGVVPVRMQEAWLLFDERAIRLAAGNPNGRTKLELPRTRDLEKVVDPKQLLFEILRKASGLTGRRLKQFRERESARRVAEYIEDFSGLRVLQAFQRLEDDLTKTLGELGWGTKPPIPPAERRR